MGLGFNIYLVATLQKVPGRLVNTHVGLEPAEEHLEDRRGDIHEGRG